MKPPPLIGITPDVGKTSGGRAEPLIVLQERYARAVEDAGGLPFVLSVTASPSQVRNVLDRLDGIILSGGNFDIHPRFYGEEALENLGQVKEERTQFELELLSQALKRDLPVLGVCAGAQTINVALGGSLYQDIATQLRGAGEHQQGNLKEHGGHKITIREGTNLMRIVRRKSLEVNTTHHQAVKKLGKGLIVNATAEDGVVEGIESEKHAFVLGVQWHPEFLTQRDGSQKKIFAAFVSACKPR
jgi:putative glutamine amidotransferase